MEQNEAYVRIDGKYYPKSPDNIYNINGKRIFYVNNRARTIGGPAANSGQAPAQKQ
jgi:hypothetical protein